MNVLPRLVFVLVLVLVAVVIYATSAPLPPRVATHFGPGGVANGFMTRDGYVAFILAFATLLPILMTGLIGFVPGIAASNIKGRARGYWLARERREASLAWIGSHACWLGVLLCVFLLGVHLLTVQANMLSQPRLPESSMFALLGVFLAALGVWIAMLLSRFRTVG